MRRISQIKVNLSFPLLIFQFVTFSVPWLVVLWLSNTGSVQEVADYSYLLAILSPLCLLLASPNRNYMLSDSQLSSAHCLGMRYWLILIGYVGAIAIGWYTHLMVLALAIYTLKVLEFLYDFTLTQGLKTASFSVVSRVVMGKSSMILIAIVVAYLFRSLPFTLFSLAILFYINSLWNKAFSFHVPENKYQLLATILPLSASSLIYSLYFNIPRYVYGYEKESGYLAIYTVSVFLLTLSLMINNAVCQTKLAQWSEAFNQQKFSQLRRSIYGSLALIFCIYIGLQLFHIPIIANWFWHLHNDIQQQQTDYIDFYHFTLVFSWGPYLFSFAIYLLVIIKQHKVLLMFSAINMLLTLVAALVCYHFINIRAVIWCINISGLIHFGLCYLRYWRATGGNLVTKKEQCDGIV